MTSVAQPITVALGDRCQIVRGVSFDSSQVSSSARPGLLPVLRAGNISEALDLERDLIWVPSAVVADAQRLRVGDIVMCLSSGSATVVGKSARLDRPFSGTAGAFCGIIRPHDPRDSEWISSWLRSPMFAAWRSQKARGSNIQNLRTNEIASIRLPWPDESARRLIVRRLRDALVETGRASAAITAQAEASATLQDAILDRAFAVSPPIFAGAPPAAAPAGWRWAELTRVARLESGHTPSRHHPEWWGGDIPWIALPDIRALDGKVAHDTTERTNDLGIANSSARVLPRHTVVMSRTASVGFVTIIGRPMATSQDFVNWVCGPELDPHFLAYALRASREYIRNLAAGAVHKTVYMPTLHSLHVCMPSVSEQRRIVAALDARLAEAERLRAVLTRRRAEIEALPAAILGAAFDPAAAQSFVSASKQAPADVLPAEQADYARRGAIAAYLVDRLHAQPTFGRVMFQKLLYLTEAHVGVKLGGEYERRAAGPMAVQQLPMLEQIAAHQQWFHRAERESGKGYRYAPGPRISERVAEAERMLGARRAKLDRLIKLLGGELTVRAEVVATLFAAWNDFLIDGHEPTDEEIVREMRANWHPKKERFAEEGLHRALAWMRRKKIVPTGRGPRTRMQQHA